MIFWWKGIGQFVVIGAGLLPYYAFKEQNLPLYVTFAISAGLCAVIGFILEKKRKGIDSFMSIPVKYWTLIYAGVAGALFWDPTLL